MNDKAVAIVGLGYVGLPVAVLAQEKGWQVIGVDTNEEKVSAINAGMSPFEDEELQAQLKRFPIHATTDIAEISEAAVVVVAVPTPVTHDKQPDLRPLTSALESMLPHLQSGQLLSVESTINPGVMSEVVQPILERRPEVKVGLVHCPERVNPGDPKWTVRNIPRVIGGDSPESAKRGQEFYESILEAPVKPMQSMTEAEAVKIMENTFRDVNIAFVNEMAKSFDKLGIDVKHVIEGAATKPFAFMPHYPGNGVGGHCISVDPYYMIERARQVGFDHLFLKLAREINDSMPAYTIELMERGLQEKGIDVKNATVALLGLAYKKDIDDLRESPALTIRQLLEEKQVQLHVYDPHVQQESSVQSLEEAVTNANVVILGTNHTEFIEQLTPAYLQERGISIVVDGKNALDADGIAAAGVRYLGIGRSR